jgi:hypothetical protein
MAIEEHSIDFLLTGTVDGFFFNPERPEGLKFTSGPPKPFNVSLRPEKPEEDGAGLRHGLRCGVSTSGPAAPEHRIFVEELIKRKFIASPDTPTKLPLILRGEIKIDQNGHLTDGFSVPFELYPPPLQTLCDDVYRELYDGLVRFLKLLRWQQEIDAPHNVFEFRPSLYWRVVPGAYWHVGRKRQDGRPVRSPAGITWSLDDEREFAALWAQPATEEPLAHELLREAKGALHGSPRSALLLTATALETGVKTHIGNLLPDAAWLLSEIPSPPVYQMLRRYLPVLHDERGIGLSAWPKLNPLFNDAQKLAEYRNDLTHTGQMPETVLAALPGLINSVSDLLYILDFIEGHEWAKECVGLHTIRAKTRTLLGWPAPKRKRIFASVSVE